MLLNSIKRLSTKNMDCFSFAKTVGSCLFEKSEYLPILYYNQKRSVFTPLVLYGGFINLFAVTQLWNPHFPRSLLTTLIRTGNIMFFLGLICPS